MPIAPGGPEGRIRQGAALAGAKQTGGAPCFDTRNPCQFRRTSQGPGPGFSCRFSLDIEGFTPDSSLGGAGADRYRSAGLRPLRLVAQDASLSRWKQGFDSPRGRHRPGCTEDIWVWRLVGLPRLRIKSGTLSPFIEVA